MPPFPVASLTFFFPPIQLALSSSGAYSEEMKREMGRSEELEDLLYTGNHFIFPPVAGDTARAAGVPSV